MNAAALLPHTRLYGGVKRFFELGAAMARLGHTLTVYTPAGDIPEWGSYGVAVRPFRDLDSAEPDLLFFTERGFLDTALATRARYRVFYHVRPSDRVGRIARHPDIHVFTNSSNILRKYRWVWGARPIPMLGGVNCDLYRPREPRPRRPGDPFTVMAYGRITERRKGTQFVVEACERLHRRYPNLRLLLFDTPVDEGMRRAAAEFRTSVPFELVLDHPVERNEELFHRADVFVAAERKTGWANTVAEAMAAGIPAIATPSGTLDMIVDGETGLRVRRSARSIAAAIERVMTAPDPFRADLARNGRRHIEQFDWGRLAARIVAWHERMEAGGGR